MQKRRKTSRRRTIVRRAAKSGAEKAKTFEFHAGIRQDSDPIIKIMIILKLRHFNSVFAFSVRTILDSP